MNFFIKILIFSLSEGCNITVPQVPKIVFKMMENVSKYLKAAANYGVTVLFTPPDLVNSENMMAVILSIHDLAEVVISFFFLFFRSFKNTSCSG